MRWKFLLALGGVALAVGCCQLAACKLIYPEGAPEVVADGAGAAEVESGAGGGVADKPVIDLESKKLPSIAVGTVIGKGAPAGWTDLVLFATPTLTADDLRDAPKLATYYARMFKFVVVARTARVPGKDCYRLDSVGRGFAIDIKGRETVISSKDTRGADMGLFGSRILAENERILDEDVRQVVRTDTMSVFDGQAIIRVGTDHVKRVVRHVVTVNPETGKVTAFIWLLTRDGAKFKASEKDIQMLPPSMQEARLLSIKRDKFTLGMPTPEAFALVRIPQGTAIPYTPELEKLATAATFTEESAAALEKQLQTLAATAGKVRLP